MKKGIEKKILAAALLCMLTLSGCGSRVGGEPDQAKSVVKISEHEEGVSEPEAYYQENNYIRKQLNLEKADLTHDGVEDYIVTAMYFTPGTEVTAENLDAAIQEQIWYVDVFVEVYDGSKITGEEKVGEPIWIGGYSATHAGNGQINLVHRDGRDYLLESSLWTGQGMLGYTYEVFSLDGEGNKAVADDYNINFVMESGNPDRVLPEAEQKEQLTTFKNRITFWFEGGLLLAATDVDLKRQLITMGENRYVPEDFYDQKWAERQIVDAE